MEEIRPARAQDCAALERIWLAAFPSDTPTDVAAFLTCFSPEQALVYTVDGQPVSMLFVLPVPLAPPDGGDPLSAGYVYAVATLPAWRGRGFAGSLLGEAARRAAKSGMSALFLRPATESLREYYRRFGYRDAFGVRQTRISRQQAETLADPSPPPVRRRALPSPLRKNWLHRQGAGYPLWGEAAWRYTLDVCGYDYWEADGWSVLCRIDGDRLRVFLVGDFSERLAPVCAHLCRTYAFAQAAFVLCAAAEPDSITPSGMLCRLDEAAHRRLPEPMRLWNELTLD